MPVKKPARAGMSRELLVGVAGDEDWLASVTHATYDHERSLLKVRFWADREWPDAATTNVDICLVEKDYPGIHQALRVAEVCCKTALSRGEALSGWSYLLGPDVVRPVFLFKDGNSPSAATGRGWHEAVNHVSVSEKRWVAMDIQTNSEGDAVRTLSGSRFLAKVVDANFPGLVELIRTCEDLGMSSYLVATHVKARLNPEASASMALPGLDLTNGI